MKRLTRRDVLGGLGVAGMLGLAGCTAFTGGNGGGSGDTPGGEETTTGGDPPSPSPSPSPSPDEGGGDASGPPVASQRLPVMYDFAELRDNVQSGGPPKDGIPPIDEPEFLDVAGGDRILAPGDVVFGVARGSDAKAYPQSVLVWHEIVNDTLAGLPVSVTYCPLTGTVLGFERGDTTFGTSGNLLNNNLVMYDRSTDSRWPQVLGTAIEGPLEKESLREFRLVWTTWEQWKALHPETVVLSEQTGFARNYDRDPYGRYNPKSGYYTRESTLFPPLGGVDGRYHSKEIFMGARVPAGAMAFRKESLADAGVVDGQVGDTTYTAVYDERLDTAYVYHNHDGVTVALDGATATVDGEQYDPDTLPLEGVHAFDAMWFAWIGFYPETEVFA